MPFHVDESHWIGLSAPFEAFFSGRFSDPIWQERQDKAVTATVTYYVIGAARRIGGFPPERLNRPWRWFASKDENLAEGRMPDPRLLWWARAGVTTAAVGALFVFFRLLSRAAGRPAAYVWLALALVNPYLRDTLRHAMNEGVLLWLLALVILAASRALPYLDRSPDAPGARVRAAAWLVIAAVAAGLAAQTKTNGALAVPGIVIVMALAAGRAPGPWGGRLWRVAVASALVAGVSWGTFIGANPTLWPDPVRETIRTVRARVGGDQRPVALPGWPRPDGEAAPGRHCPGSRVLGLRIGTVDHRRPRPVRGGNGGCRGRPHRVDAPGPTRITRSSRCWLWAPPSPCR